MVKAKRKEAAKMKMSAIIPEHFKVKMTYKKLRLYCCPTTEQE